VKRRTIRRGPGKQRVDGASFHLIDEVHYIQQRAAEQDSRVITLPQWLLFSTQTGDVWLLEPADHLAVPLAREGDPLPVYIEETDKNFTIGWTGTYRIDGPAFVSQNESQAVSGPSSATQHDTSSSRLALKI
jgi:hypothetical protein